MTLKEILDAIDELSWEDVETVQARIEQRREADTTQMQTYDDLQQEIEAALQDVKPGELKAGTMDAERLKKAVEAMRAGMTQEELDAIADAMDEAYIKPESI